MHARLGDEIGKRSAFASAEQELYLNLARTRAAMEGDIGAVLKREGLTESSYNVLRILRGWRGKGERGEDGARANGARTCGQILREMVVRAADVTRLIDRLEKRGFVERLAYEGDGRVVLVRITPEGESAVERLDEPLPAAHVEQFSHMTAEEIEALNRLLERARERADGGG